MTPVALSEESFGSYRLRRADGRDAVHLAAFEREVFESDRISLRQFRYLLTRAHAETWMAESCDVATAMTPDVAFRVTQTPMGSSESGKVVSGALASIDRLAGYVTVLFSRGTAMARLYSIAVAPQARGSGLSAALVAVAERAALAHESVVLRLEIRPDNVASQRLFKRLGYREFGRYVDFYEDHSDALRLERRLVPARPYRRRCGQPLDTSAPLEADSHHPDDADRDREQGARRGGTKGQTQGGANDEGSGAASVDRRRMGRDIAFYAQTLDFTCGPASLMMAMHALGADVTFDRRLELRVWREATTIFMTSGLGGCGPYGLALAALRRGFDVRLRLRDDHIAFFDSVRSAEKKEVIRLVQEDMRAELEAAGVPILFERLTAQELANEVADGAVPVVLISSARIYGERFPHWVVVTDVDDHFIYVHDPFVDRDEGETETDCMHLPIARREFDRMLRYGRAGLQAAVLLRVGAGAGQGFEWGGDGEVGRDAKSQGEVGEAGTFRSAIQ